MSLAAALVLLVAAGVGSVRWLRVAQREHYLAGSVSRFEGRWFRARPVNLALGTATAALIVAGAFVPPLWILAAVGLVVWPLGLGLRGHTSKLAWTRRLRTLAAVTAGLAVIVVVLTTVFGVGRVGAALVALAAPQVVDAAAWILGPIERRLLDPFVTKARTRLAQVSPDVVGITGSYGKTTTKQYLRALLAQQFEVCASPASYNNTAGLARTINEHLHPGADVLIAEMGMYDVGEIAEMCRWIEPRVGVITAIGPVHLERLGTIERVVQAKREILDGAEVAVLNVDDPRLAALADELAGEIEAGRGGAGATTVTRVIRCGSTGERLDVAVRDLGGGRARVETADQPVGRPTGHTAVEVPLAEGTHLTNLACAIGARRWPLASTWVTWPPGWPPSSRPPTGAPSRSHPGGISVIDDTFNSNPTGARRGLEALATLGPAGRRVVVTPGMVELGPRQDPENEQFARAAAQAADTLIVVKRTNRRALVRGASGGRRPGA